MKMVSVEHHLRTFTCERCGAQPGTPCVAVESGKRQVLAHASRYRQARLAGTLPLLQRISPPE